MENIIKLGSFAWAQERKLFRLEQLGFDGEKKSSHALINNESLFSFFLQILKIANTKYSINNNNRKDFQQSKKKVGCKKRKIGGAKKNQSTTATEKE